MLTGGPGHAPVRRPISFMSASESSRSRPSPPSPPTTPTLFSDAEQGDYQETQEYYPNPTYSATEIPGKQLSMLSLHIVPIAFVLLLHHELLYELNWNLKYCIACTFKPHQIMFSRSYEPLVQEFLESYDS